MGHANARWPFIPMLESIERKWSFVMFFAMGEADRAPNPGACNAMFEARSTAPPPDLTSSLAVRGHPAGHILHIGIAMLQQQTGSDRATVAGAANDRDRAILW